jgi:DNA-binding CsgD family transcriptional regulator
MDEFDTGFVADLVGHIYEAAIDPNHWNDFVAALERVYPESRVTLFGHENGRPAANLAAHTNYAASDLRSYIDHFAGCSPYLARAAVLPVGRAFHYDVLIGDGELKRTEYYNDYLRPRRLGHYGTGLVIEREMTSGIPRRGTALSLADHKNDAGRRARQLRLLGLLAPHLQRAFRLHHTIAAERASAGAAQAAFDHWAHAAMVFDAAGRVVTFNLAAETLLKGADGLWLGRGRKLCTADEAKSQALWVAIRKCAAMADDGSRPGELDGIVLPRPSGAAPLRVMMWPLPQGPGPVLPSEGQGAVLLVIFDSAQVQRTPVGWLAKQYGLSPSEQRLAEAVVNGIPLDEAADQLGIVLSTARTRLKTIQAKTNCRRQVDLVRLALSLPAVRAP